MTLQLLYKLYVKTIKYHLLRALILEKSIYITNIMFENNKYIFIDFNVKSVTKGVIKTVYRQKRLQIKGADF